MKVGHHEVGVMKMNVGGQGPEKEPGQSTDSEYKNETQGPEHRCLRSIEPLNMVASQLNTLIAEGMETLKQSGEDHGGHRGLARRGHMVSPDQTEHGDGDRTVGDKPVAENVLVGKDGNQLGDHTHGKPRIMMYTAGWE